MKRRLTSSARHSEINSSAQFSRLLFSLFFLWCVVFEWWGGVNIDLLHSQVLGMAGLPSFQKTTSYLFFILGALELFNAAYINFDNSSFLAGCFIGQSLDEKDSKEEYAFLLSWALVGLGLLRISYAGNMNSKTACLAPER